MANRVSVELNGLRELNAAMLALPPSIRRDKMLMRALHDGARVIRDEAKRRAPVLEKPIRNRHRKMGALRNNIVEHASRKTDFAVEVRVRNRGYIFGQNRTRGSRTSSSLAGNPNYWWLVEFGTSKMAARPFLRPAFEMKKFEAAQKIRDSLRRGIEVVARGLAVRAAA